MPTLDVASILITFTPSQGTVKEMLIQEETERGRPFAQEYTSYIGAFKKYFINSNFITEASEFGFPENFPLEHKVEL